MSDLGVGASLAAAVGMAVLWALNTPELRSWRRQSGLFMLQGHAGL